ncbi:MAG: adenylate/guanylate cyclase domain-containing protein [Spirochaetota bacterium]
MVKIDFGSLDPRLGRAREGGYGDVADAVRGLFERAKGTELVEINTSRFARASGLEPTRVLKAFLTLTNEGVFDLSWTVHCPHCKGRSQRESDLAKIHRDGHCHMCSVDFEAGFDQNVHLAFHASAAVAELGEVDPFEEALAGFELEPGVSFELDGDDKRFIEHPVAPGNYVLADLDNRAVLNIAIDGRSAVGRRELRWRISEDSPPITVSAQGPGRLKVFMHNASSKKRELHFARVRAPDWPNAALVSSLQEFRNFFTDEMLAPDESFDIRNLAIVFTDIKGSSAMYQRLGDATAFWIVKEHFRIMEDIVRERNGAMVKTIGDAVMAAFLRPGDAVLAARDMIEAFDRFNAEKRTKSEIVIKVGAHSGPCIAVTLNDRIDYFGSSVNIAARVQGLSDGRDIMLSRRLYEESSADEAFAEGGWSTESFSVGLKGIDEEQEIVKIAKG